jgi:hypothetical protein
LTAHLNPNKETDMRPRVVIVLAMLAALGVAAVGSGLSSRADDEPLNKKVVDIVKQVGALYKDAKSLHTDYTIETDLVRGETKQNTSLKATCDLEKPNKIALHSHSKDDKAKGLDVVCDGKHLFIHMGQRNQYTEEEAPADLTKLGLRLAALSQELSGMLFANVLHGDPYEQLMEGVTSCSYVGMEQVDRQDAHHLKFSQDAFDWEMWVAAKGKPFILKMTRTAMQGENRFASVETYRNWKLDTPIPEKVFTFTPPKDATKVEEFKR